jgi:putative hydrolase of the HAD superfamily
MRALFAPRLLSDAEADARYGLYQHHYRQSWSLYADVMPCLDVLSGCSLGVVSNGGGDKQRAKLRATAIDKLFSLIIISEEVGIAKPDPAIFLEACRRAGMSPESCAYVGDSLAEDALPSRAAGLCGFWLRRDHSSHDLRTLTSLAQLPLRLRERIAA